MITINKRKMVLKLPVRFTPDTKKIDFMVSRSNILPSHQVFKIVNTH